MKRVIICLDGTWNNDDRRATRPTNVFKLYTAIAGAGPDGVRQVAHYCRGIASSEGERFSFLKGAVGYGVAERIKHAYTLLTQSYEPGDEIYLFGFSRGAFEARSLAAFITLTWIAKSDPAFSLSESLAPYSSP